MVLLGAPRIELSMFGTRGTQGTKAGVAGASKFPINGDMKTGLVVRDGLIDLGTAAGAQGMVIVSGTAAGELITAREVRAIAGRAPLGTMLAKPRTPKSVRRHWGCWRR